MRWLEKIFQCHKFFGRSENVRLAWARVSCRSQKQEFLQVQFIGIQGYTLIESPGISAILYSGLRMLCRNLDVPLC